MTEHAVRIILIRTVRVSQRFLKSSVEVFVNLL